MNLKSLLPNMKPAVGKKWYLSRLFSKMPACLVIILCCCMLWQCTTCLAKYFASPMGAVVAYSQDFTQAPLSVTICNKGPELNYTFPELEAVDIQNGANADWVTIWAPSSRNSAQAFVTINSKNKLQLCKTISLTQGNSSLGFRLRHRFSDADYCNASKMSVYLHGQGLFHLSSYSRLDKGLLSSDKNYIFELNLETMESLSTKEFNCSQAESVYSLDSCLVAEAIRAANTSAGCLAKGLG